MLAQYGPLVGRILLAAIFIISGFNKLTGFSGTVGYFESLGLPVPAATLVLVILIEILGGLAVLIGFKTRYAAGILAVFVILSALIAHTNFAEQTQQIQFMKNLAIAGGLLYATVHGAGPLSTDNRK